MTARREFGNVTLVEERSGEVWRRPSLEDFFLDIRYGFVNFARIPVLPVAAALTLALGVGVGANTALFSV